ncbi:MAG: putative diguanylate cyclase [Phenylobacterium sp.]|nr:putative diguanylate cyclase [Phenylobacterium sp.]
MFRKLRTKLTVLYAALFGVTLLLVSMAVWGAISQAAQRQVRGELTASGTVFDRLWSMRSERLREGAALLSRDFGFREAVATGDQATIVSAMENLRHRFEVDQVFIIGVDGKVTGGDTGLLKAGEAGRLAAAFNSADDPGGVAVLGRASYQLISAPVLSPDLVGWVVFAVRLDGREMGSLERLSAIPLEAAVLHRDPAGWRANAEGGSAPGEFIDRALKQKSPDPMVLDEGGGASIALVKPLQTLMPQEAAVLVLRYPLARALAPYRPLLAVVALTGLGGLLMMTWGSWVLARGVTRPISALDEAAHRLQRGEDAYVEVKTQDEIGRLAESFNTMVTAIRDRERRITHLAMHDEETGLPNRLALEQVVDSLTLQPRARSYVAAVGVQRFDDMRGAVGYAFAAQVVRKIGNRVGALPGALGVARLATDVVGFTLTAPDDATAEEMAVAFLGRLEQPLKVGGDTIDVVLNLGLAPLSEGARSAIDLANIALDQARTGRRRVAIFDAEAYGDPSSNLSLMSSMLRGLDAGELELHYQPKYDLRRREVAGAEALVRWRHPVRGMLAPDLFIPMAEETGHIRTLTEWVVRRAIADRRAMAAAGHDVRVSVNISGRTLGERDFADFALAQAATARGGLCFEITETAVIENPELALEMLDAFAEAGIAISIDDFGTGLSSLAYLKRIRGDELKIDKSIVQGVTESQRDALIVRSTIDLAHSLGLKVVAEGVETNACCALLSAMGCDQAQGYLIAKPLPLKDFLTFLGEDAVSRRHYG